MRFDEAIWIIKKHINDYNHSPSDFARWNDTKDTKRFARLFGVTRLNRKKVEIWEDILKVHQLIDKKTN